MLRIYSSCIIYFIQNRECLEEVYNVYEDNSEIFQISANEKLEKKSINKQLFNLKIKTILKQQAIFYLQLFRVDTNASESFCVVFRR